MNTKYNINDIVLVKGKVLNIKINNGGIEYTVQLDGKKTPIKAMESEIASKFEEKRKEKEHE